ncbi:uncharacterized protein RCC_02540 [Ramularia collo-cygni]|uniref:Uncharacterized protein n=1 Tax=Ramularia collo-cygni TaxID=112498 RepID=A0A2D3USG5_9PEZI|nr:uncharacterized protein RCC_02540 [Ramularia collo-cygni]CZT16705.1 uncharacterized protein RCC_02540 [Ramularia collo-cygni]
MARSIAEEARQNSIAEEARQNSILEEARQLLEFDREVASATEAEGQNHTTAELEDMSTRLRHLEDSGKCETLISSLEDILASKQKKAADMKAKLSDMTRARLLASEPKKTEGQSD